MGNADVLSKYLADNILSLRRKKGLSQDQLAKEAGIPRSTLTHIESGSGNPSLANLAKVSAALRVGVEELLSRPRSDCQLVLAGEIPVEKRSQGRALLHKLLPDRIKGLEIDRMELDGKVLMSGHPHLQGTKEYLSTISGEITVYVAGQSFVVKKGDVLAFPADQPHSYRNQKQARAVGISVVVPVPVGTY